MRKNRALLCGTLIGALIMAITGVGAAFSGFFSPVFATGEEELFTVFSINLSPMRQSVVLGPGDTYKSSFKVTNPGSSRNDLTYEVNVEPYYVDEEYRSIYTNESDRGRIAEWITITSPKTGTVAPNNSDTVEFTINVPADAPAGGQYAYISVTTAADGEGDVATGGVGITERLAIGHIVYAEITGDVVQSGAILSASVPSFLLSGEISGNSLVQNTGNVHATAAYTMKVYPIFSDKAVYDNSEEPEEHIILPERTYYNETAWEGTPLIGIFKVLYTVEFQGLKTEATKVVIVCPIWLLFLIIAAAMILVIRIVMLVKTQKSIHRVREKDAA